MLLTIRVVFKDAKSKKKNAGNRQHSILRVFDTLPNFVFATSETNRDYL